MTRVPLLALRTAQRCAARVSRRDCWTACLLTQGHRFVSRFSYVRSTPVHRSTGGLLRFEPHYGA